MEGQNPAQVIAESCPIRIALTDISSLPDDQREDSAIRMAEEETRRPFDLEEGPLLRLTLFLLGYEDHLLVLVVHHIVADGWSMEIFAKELAALYASNARGTKVSLRELPMQYADFAQWQRDWLHGKVLEDHLAYWREQLDGNLPVLELPADYPRPLVQSYRGGRESADFSPPLTKALKGLSRNEGATLFMTLLASFAVLLYRHTGETDILVGTPIAGRNRIEIEELIGFFVNTLVLRTDLTGQPSFRELLRRVREAALGADAHQDLPFEKLVEELQPARDLSRNPLFQAFFVFQQTPMELRTIPGLAATPVELDNRTAKFDLSLYISEEGDQLSVAFEYNADLFKPTTIRLMLDQLERLLEAIVADPERSIDELPLHTDGERHRILQFSRRSHADYPSMSCLHDLIEAQAIETPDATAVVYTHEELTYRELDRRANQLAHYLRRLGVGPDVLVGVCADRSLEIVVGLLGILKAGGAYVPLDPSFPRDRLGVILEDTNVVVLLTQERFRDHVPPHRAKVVQLDSDWEKIASHPEIHFASGVSPANLAYVMYTSGSTGRPKGVMTTHRGGVNYLSFLRRAYGIGASDTILQLAPYSFDASVRDIMGPLTVGAKLVLPQTVEVRDFAKLHAAIAEHRVTAILSIVPSLLKTLAASAPRESVNSSLRLLLVSGEALHAATVEDVRKALGGQIQIVNQYGPTECTMTSTYFPIPTGNSNGDPVPLGEPASNYQIYVLDHLLEVTPVGVPGEICIGGDGVARGYLARPGLTAERFVPNPYSDLPSSRLFRTGDRARYSPTGDLQFLGRLDDQVKVLGCRVELGEIESVLKRHPEVLKAAVLAKPDQDGSQRLVAYIVPATGGSITASDVRAYLSSQLPSYMVPADYVSLRAIPMTPNGKVDRKQLLSLDESSSDTTEKLVPPRDRLELEMAELWEEVLGRRPISIFDDFFAVGGNSLRAVLLGEAIRQRFGISVSPAALYLTPTVAHLCEHLPRRARGCLVPLRQSDSSSPPLFLLHPQSGDVLCYFHLVRALNAEGNIYGLQAVGYDSDESPLEDIESMADLYVREIRQVAPEGPYRLAGWSFGGNLAFEISRLLESAGAKIEFLGVFDARAFGIDELEGRISKRSDIVEFGVLSGVEGSELEGRDEDAALEILLRHAKDAHLISQVEKSETMQRMVRVFAASGRAADRYRCSEKVGADVYLFKARDRHPKFPSPPVNPGSWQRRTHGELHEILIPGSHHDFLSPPHVFVLAEVMNSILRGLRHPVSQTSPKSENR